MWSFKSGALPCSTLGGRGTAPFWPVPPGEVPRVFNGESSRDCRVWLVLVYFHFSLPTFLESSLFKKQHLQYLFKIKFGFFDIKVPSVFWELTKRERSPPNLWRTRNPAMATQKSLRGLHFTPASSPCYTAVLIPAPHKAVHRTEPSPSNCTAKWHATHCPHFLLPSPVKTRPGDTAPGSHLWALLMMYSKTCFLQNSLDNMMETQKAAEGTNCCIWQKRVWGRLATWYRNRCRSRIPAR